MTRRNAEISDRDSGRDRTYLARDFFLLRAPALPTRGMTNLLAAGADPAHSDPAGWEARYLRGLLDLWAKRGVRSAISLAAPDLARAVEGIDTLSARDRRRAMMSLGRYLNRMSMRPTPLATVAGVAVGAFTGPAPAPADSPTPPDSPTATRPDAPTGTRLGVPAIVNAVAGPDMGWVLHLFKSVTDAPRVRPELELRTNDLIHRSRGRAWLSTADAYGEGSRRSASVRWSPAVRLVLESARTPKTFGALHEELTQRYPAVAPEKVTALLDQLVELAFLITAHRPVLLEGSEQPPLSARLATACDGDAIAALASVEAAVAAFNAVGDVAGLEALQEEIAPAARQVSKDYSGPLLRVDARLNIPARPVLPAEVQRLAEDAAEILTTVGDVYQYPVPLRDYATAFTERYGARAEVPVLEVLSEETGLGAPAGFRNPPRSFELQPTTTSDRSREDRDVVLHRLAADAISRGSLEVVLDERWTAELRRHDDRPLRPAIDVQLQVAPPAAPGSGWRGVVTAVAYGGRTFARFHDLLGTEGRRGLAELAEAEAALLPGVAVVELTYLPEKARATNVAVRPAVRALELPLNVAPGLPADQVIALEDVVVGVREGRMYLHSPVFGCDLHVTQHTMLNPLMAPNVGRFLLDVSSAAFRGVSTFDWGSLSTSMPFLPRVVRGDLVLKRARWLLSASGLPAGCTGSSSAFTTAVAAWREQWNVPRLVVLTQGDNTILLDLESAPSLEELRLAAARDADFTLRIEEALPGPEDGFLRDEAGAPFAAEVVVPVLRGRPAPAPRATAVARRPVTDAERLRPVGGPWVYAKLYVEHDAQDALLVGEVTALARSLADRGLAGHPFYLRYGDPAPHLRLRFRATDPARAAELLGEVATWAHALVVEGRIIDVSFETYRREIERYGGPDLIDAAEELFCQDSAATLALLRHLAAPAPAGEVPLEKAALTVLSLEAVGRVLVPDVAERHDLVRMMAGPQAGGAEYRAVARRLWQGHTAPGGEAAVLRQVDALWRPRGTAYAARAAELERAGALWSDRRDVLRSLCHMHSNRMGLRREQEDAAYGMWRRLLDRVAATGHASTAGGSR
ncbi:lantibiotic dehydratase [Streptomyces sp. NPDC053079]|uniref:lantibiotic dehydratase n=1 Tax=Streptomyces sp. NPDC053079 TaxID=3365697 RepID=UPI0037D6153B